MPAGVDIRLLTTCPQSKDLDARTFRPRIEEIARWSEQAGCDGILVYTDNSLVDPWLAAQLIIEATSSLVPLVAVQPVYMHPWTAAKMIATIGFVHDRRVDVNMVAGGFRNDLRALGDETEHDIRYERVLEYAQIVAGLLATSGPFSFHGRFYDVTNARMRPPLHERLQPRFTVSGSSAAGVAVARTLGATAIKYPQPARDEVIPEADDRLGQGIRLGIVTRETDDEAWAAARHRFPADRRGQVTHRLAMSVTDSSWHHQLSARHDGSDPSVDTYWLWPFQNYRTFCPYLVGSYERVAAELAQYLARGFRTMILDIPESAEDLLHTQAALGLARAEAAC